jgi:hypothetical protein
VGRHAREAGVAGMHDTLCCVRCRYLNVLIRYVTFFIPSHPPPPSPRDSSTPRCVFSTKLNRDCPVCCDSLKSIRSVRRVRRVSRDKKPSQRNTVSRFNKGKRIRRVSGVGLELQGAWV